ncbi:hypothetical protein Q5752_000093 [Cryptotrichosporon argae]
MSGPTDRRTLDLSAGWTFTAPSDPTRTPPHHRAFLPPSSSQSRASQGASEPELQDEPEPLEEEIMEGLEMLRAAEAAAIMRESEMPDETSDPWQRDYRESSYRSPSLLSSHHSPSFKELLEDAPGPARPTTSPRTSFRPLPTPASSARDAADVLVVPSPPRPSRSALATPKPSPFPPANAFAGPSEPRSSGSASRSSASTRTSTGKRKKIRRAIDVDVSDDDAAPSSSPRRTPKSSALLVKDDAQRARAPDSAMRRFNAKKLIERTSVEQAQTPGRKSALSRKSQKRLVVLSDEDDDEDDTPIAPAKRAVSRYLDLAAEASDDDDEGYKPNLDDLDVGRDSGDEGGGTDSDDFEMLEHNPDDPYDLPIDARFYEPIPDFSTFPSTQPDPPRSARKPAPPANALDSLFASPSPSPPPPGASDARDSSVPSSKPKPALAPPATPILPLTLIADLPARLQEFYTNHYKRGAWKDGEDDDDDWDNMDVATPALDAKAKNGYRGFRRGGWRGRGRGRARGGKRR